MISAVVLDLDGTIIDSSGLDAMREARDWRGCARNVTKTAIFPGVPEMLAALVAAELRLGLCTAAVSFYANALLKHHKISGFDARIHYHDAKPPKPHPAPVLATLAKLKAKGSEAVGVGDRVEDSRAYRAAGVYSIGAGWNTNLQRNAGWSVIAATPAEVAAIISGRR